MKNKAAWQWIIVTSLWLIGGFWVFSNHQKVASVNAVRESNEQLRNDVVFKLRHAASLSRIMDIHQEMALPVESLKMGLLTIKSQLTRLAVAYDLEDPQIMTKPEVANGNQVPMAFHAKGNLKDVVRLLMVLQEEPHLAVDKTQIQIHPLYRKTTLNMDMTLAYTIVLPPHTEPNAIQSAQFSVEGRK